MKTPLELVPEQGLGLAKGPVLVLESALDQAQEQVLE